MQIYYATRGHYSHGELRFTGKDPRERGSLVYFLPTNSRFPDIRERFDKTGWPKKTNVARASSRQRQFPSSMRLDGQRRSFVCLFILPGMHPYALRCLHSNLTARTLKYRAFLASNGRWFRFIFLVPRKLSRNARYESFKIRSCPLVSSFAAPKATTPLRALRSTKITRYPRIRVKRDPRDT